VTGAECLADILYTGKVFEVAPGTSISEVTRNLGEDFIEQQYGRRGKRLLRRDHGLVEVTFTGEPSWACAWLAVEIQRLAFHDELIAEVFDRHGVSFSRYTGWSEVESALAVPPGGVRYEEVEPQDGFRAFRVNGGPAVIRVVDDRDSQRGDLPGDGDVWGIEIR
jgi:hypothetical protein